MRIGTKSLLFGAHQFLIHPLFVLAAWVKLYGWPEWRMLLAIVIHDWGYWGSPNMDGEEGENHPLWAEDVFYTIAQSRPRWWSSKWSQKWMAAGQECAFHSRFIAKRWHGEPSRLCWADKLGTAYYPAWLWVFLTSLTGEVKEYMDQRKYEIHLGINAPTDTPWQFFRRYKALARTWIREQAAKRAESGPIPA
ncbi:MAG: hypothetical protein ABFE07_28910 [Armatimonadia bacterium]